MNSFNLYVLIAIGLLSRFAVMLTVVHFVYCFSELHAFLLVMFSITLEMSKRTIISILGGENK